MENLRALCNACDELKSVEERNERPQQRWLEQLVAPGSSLGGACPKANAVDADRKFYVAKFPSKKESEDTEWIEHFSHLCARKAGIEVAKARVIPVTKGRH